MFLLGRRAAYIKIVKFLVAVLNLTFLASCSLDADLSALKVDPIEVTFSLSSEQVTSLSSIPVEVNFSEAVKDLSVESFKVENAQIENFVGSGQIYRFDLVPQGDGVVSVSMRDNSLLSFTNTPKAILDAEASVTVDRTPPMGSLNVAAGGISVGNSAAIFVYTLTYEGADTINLSSNDISISGSGSAGCEAAVSGTGNQERTVAITNCSGDGDMILSVASGVAQDLVGNSSLSVLSSAVVIDNIAPFLSVSSASVSIGNSATSFEYTVTYTGASLITLGSWDISYTGSSAGCSASVSGSGATSRTVSITGCTDEGSLGFTIAAGSASDEAGNLSAGGSALGTVTIDNTPPSLSISSPAPTSGDVSTSFVWTLTYSEASAVTLSSSDITFNGLSSGCVAVVTGSGLITRTVSVSGCSGLLGSLSITVGASSQDAAGNQNILVGPSNSVSIVNPIWVSFASSWDVVNEGDSANTQAVSITLSAPATEDMTVSYKVASDYSTAINPTNYDLSPVGSIVIPAGSMTGSIDYSYMGNTVNDGSKVLQLVLTDMQVAGAVTKVGEHQLRRVILDEEGDVVSKVSTSASSSHTCEVTSSGVLRCWGHNFSGQLGDGTTTDSTTPVVVIDPAVVYSSVVTGSFFSCGITNLGEVKCWGDNSSGQLGNGTTVSSTTPVVADSGITYSAVSTGNAHACGLTTSGVLKCWGNNANAQLGDGSMTNRIIPVEIDTGVTYSSVSAGTSHTCGITTTGVLKCWGRNSDRQVGSGSTSSWINSPVIIDTGVSYSSVSAGGSHTCGITTAGALKCWGSNFNGKLGDGTYTTRATPVVINSGVVYGSVSAGGNHTCGLTNSGVLKCWGNNTNSQLGDGTYLLKSTPFLIDAEVTYASVSAGANHSCALTTSGILKCWGGNQYGQQGNGIKEINPSPLFVDPGVTYSSISAGASQACALTTSGALRCWGRSGEGALGDGTTKNRTSPIGIDTAATYRSVSASRGGTTCGVTTSGVLKCWGYNNRGQVGDGTTTSRLNPVVIDEGVSYSVVAVGYEHACAVTATGVLKCWGRNALGALGDGTTTSRLNPVVIDEGVSYSSVSIVYNHTCAITTDEVLKCWGWNGLGQLGDGTMVNATSPVVIDPGTAYSNVGTGDSHTCGVTTAGVLKCWGSNQYGKIGDGTTTSRTTPVVIDAGVSYRLVSASFQSSCGVTTVGVLKCWGYNLFGQLGDGTTTNSTTPVMIDAGVSYSSVSIQYYQAFGLTSSGSLKSWGYNRAAGILGLGEPDYSLPAVVTPP